MSYSTYAGLVAEVAVKLNRTNFEDRIPNLIVNVEAELNRILNVPEMEAVASLSTTGESVALPADFWEARNAYLDTDPRAGLEEVSLAYLRERYSAQTTGQPQVYAISGANIVLGPAPDSTYALKLTYKQTIPALTEVDDTNWLLTRHPDVYLYGILTHAKVEEFDEDDRVALWRNAFDLAVAQIQKAGQRKRYGAAPLRLRSPVAWGG